MTESRLLGLSLAVNDLSLDLGLSLLLLVGLDPVDEVLSAARVLHVFHTDVDSFGQYTLPDTLVDNDTEGVLCHIVDDTSTSVVTLMWHALLYCSITTNVNNVPLLVRLHVLRQRNDTSRAKLAREQVTRAAPVTR